MYNTSNDQFRSQIETSNNTTQAKVPFYDDKYGKHKKTINEVIFKIKLYVLCWEMHSLQVWESNIPFIILT